MAKQPPNNQIELTAPEQEDAANSSENFDIWDKVFDTLPALGTIGGAMLARRVTRKGAWRTKGNVTRAKKAANKAEKIRNNAPPGPKQVKAGNDYVHKLDELADAEAAYRANTLGRWGATAAGAGGGFVAGDFAGETGKAYRKDRRRK